MRTQIAVGRAPALTDAALAGIAWRIGRTALGRLRVGSLAVVLPDGNRHAFGDRAASEQAEIRFHDDRALVRMLVGGETGAGEAYMEGLWSSPDLVTLIRVAALNREALALSSGWWRVPLQLRRTIAHRLRRNTPRQSRRNIAAHYDLGNDLYRLFLDETMTYSSAVFASPDQSLADAQRNKYRLIAEGAGLTDGREPAGTSSRSERAGAASPCMPPASSAAGSPRSRSRRSSTPWPAIGSGPPASRTASISSCATTARSAAATTRSSRSR